MRNAIAQEWEYLVEKAGMKANWASGDPINFTLQEFKGNIFTSHLTDAKNFPLELPKQTVALKPDRDLPPF